MLNFFNQHLWGFQYLEIVCSLKWGAPLPHNEALLIWPSPAASASTFLFSVSRQLTSDLETPQQWHRRVHGWSDQVWQELCHRILILSFCCCSSMFFPLVPRLNNVFFLGRWRLIHKTVHHLTMGITPAEAIYLPKSLKDVFTIRLSRQKSIIQNISKYTLWSLSLQVLAKC